MALIDRDFVRSNLTGPDKWCRTHGSSADSDDLGAGMLYYGLAYSLRATTCMCLGSGGGFVPRLMRQAQRDLGLADSRTILVDGAGSVPQAKRDIWGTPEWTAEDSFLRTHYPEIELVLDLTEKAFRDVFQPAGIRVDFLHIDADHHYEGVRRDWDLYTQLVPDEGLITLHDTVNHRPPCGVPKLVEEIREEGVFAVLNFPISYGTAVLKRNPS